ncbi:MAG TPA: hypothetical protein PLY79_11965 [Ferruginibacter sp.]|nr:hypothetical protein [Ferruginibacter sp.]
MQKQNIIVLYVDRIEESFFDEFISTVDRSDLGLLVEGRPEPGPFACAEWFIPTAIAVFLGKPYFESFLKEMGKDHYTLLKEGISRLCAKTVSSRRFEPVLMSSLGGKINQNNPYTLSFSVMAEARNGYNFKLLLPKLSNDFDYHKATDKFMDFMADYHSDDELSHAFKIIKLSGLPRGTILVKYNPETSRIEWQDHLPPEIRERVNVQQENPTDS